MKNITFLVFHLGIQKEGKYIVIREFPLVEMIKYSSKKCAQPHNSLSCKLGNSAQFSIRTPIELNTLCFVLILIHYTSLNGDFVNTNTPVCA